MSISVLIPAYNCASTIALTIESVLQQTLLPDEILVMNDGSSDKTEEVLRSFGKRIRVYSQLNSGVAKTRNELVARSSGDLIAFVDSDDLWHPDYLKVQYRRFQEYPTAVAFWTGHVNFNGNGDFAWKEISDTSDGVVEVIPPLDFFRRYNTRTGPYSCFSYCCVPKRVFALLGTEPFRESGCEDSHCCSLLVLHGSVVTTSTDLVAYRLRDDSLSNNHGWAFGVWVRVFEVLEERYSRDASPALLKAFSAAFASKRRSYAKLLMGMGKTTEARAQLRESVCNSSEPNSVAKSVALWSMTYLPKAMQPKWPSQYRR